MMIQITNKEKELNQNMRKYFQKLEKQMKKLTLVNMKFTNYYHI